MEKEIIKQELYEKSIQDLIISADIVAHVQLNNPLEHALLVLIKSGYSAIPVLDELFHLKGLISTTMILDATLGIERIEVEQLSKKCVKDVMNTEVPCIQESESFFKGLKLSINNAFLCVVDEKGVFKGILTRRAILKFVNRYIHEN
ncbi:cyclic-di-AMP-binding protein CbpB [Bacillus taeanensis]|uniref:CBS domain-containing protein n=1 Tax=Bacillus taeanensis TaxID=273032 RepID=A0A366XWJ1_9BACI|nr:cyclic-di-AMP-binding protein CbpB [Bacillus taeanensis]RBW69996.1 CBS domain-containing protein [Bacillus taeanensis]